MTEGKKFFAIEVAKLSFFQSKTTLNQLFAACNCHHTYKLTCPICRKGLEKNPFERQGILKSHYNARKLII